jgi:glycosyltransferase involved in cell wall biosynthesis
VVRTERALATITDGLIAVGTRVRDDLLAAGIGTPDQYFVIPPGVDLPQPPPRSTGRERLNLPDKGLVVLFVGRLTQVKRPERFVEIALRLSERFPNTVFVVAGDGELLEAMRLQGRPLGSRLRFLGWTGQMSDVYAAADIVVLTSDNEGTPVSLIEAALAGRPVVATDVGSTREVVEDGVTGLLGDRSASSLSDHVARLLANDAERERMGGTAREHAGSRFSRARLVSDVERVYLKLAASRGIA